MLLFSNWKNLLFIYLMYQENSSFAQFFKYRKISQVILFELVYIFYGMRKNNSYYFLVSIVFFPFISLLLLFFFNIAKTKRVTG